MFTKAKNIRRFIKLGLYGDAGTGKTRFALSFPKPAVIDAERGSLPFSDSYDFDYLDANHWPELLGTLDWLETGKHKYQTLVIDPMTVFYQDLIDIQVQERLNRSGREILINADWGMIKRRWKSLLNRLIDLNMHVVLVMREKDQYEEYTDPQTGQTKSRKTGEQTFDADKATKYVFDYIFQCVTAENKKQKSCKFFTMVEKTRRDEIAKFSNFDITKKKGFDAIFKPVLDKILGGEVAPPPRKTEKDPSQATPQKPPAEAAAAQKPAGNGDPKPDPLPPPRSSMERAADLTQRFGAGISPDQPEATADDFKVLFTRAGQMTWPNGEKFTSKDGKTMIKTWYKVESTKELRKPQVNWLFEQFGQVLAGKARLARDESGIPFVAMNSPIDTQF